MAQPVRLLAPAKLNLYLRVVGKRPDGFHELETLFERIDLADELIFSPASRLTLTCADPALSCGEDNLVMKAARALQAATGTQAGASIQLTKRIPIAAGLGGGSSDAATTLLGLNQLWELGLAQQQLMKLGASLGSDVAFFLSGASFAIGRGRGERCEPVSGGRLVQIVVTPQETLSTKEVYAGAQFDLTAPKPPITIVQHALSNGPALAGLAHGLWNDLEREAIRRCPVISDIRTQLLAAGCLAALVSGSGSSVFGLCHAADQAQAIVDRLRVRAPRIRLLEIVQTA